jgi:hypothetical protein
VQPVQPLVHHMQLCAAVGLQQGFKKGGAAAHGCCGEQRRQLGQQDGYAGGALLSHHLQQGAAACPCHQCRGIAHRVWPIESLIGLQDNQGTSWQCQQYTPACSIHHSRHPPGAPDPACAAPAPAVAGHRTQRPAAPPCQGSALPPALLQPLPAGPAQRHHQRHLRPAPAAAAAPPAARMPPAAAAPALAAPGWCHTATAQPAPGICGRQLSRWAVTY